MSADDLAVYGTSLGLGDKIDNTQSMRFNRSGNQTTGSGTAGGYQTSGLVLQGVSGLLGGNGLVNNQWCPVPNNGSNGGYLNYSLAVALPCTTTQGATSATIAMTNTTGIEVGMLCVRTSVPVNAVVSSIISGTSITLSASTTADVASGAILQFYTLANNGNAGDQSVQGVQGSGL
jgi:hypothetical protein